MTAPTCLRMVTILVDVMLELKSSLTRIRGKDDTAGGVNDHSGLLGIFAGGDGSFNIAALGADAGNKQSHVADNLPNLFKLSRVGGADNQHTVAVAVPVLRHALGNNLPQGFTIVF